METAFDDPDEREAETLSFDGKNAEVAGNGERARECFGRAAELRNHVALRTTGRPRSRSVLAIGATCLYARAGRYDQAIEAAKRFLAEPDALTASAADELRGLLREFSE
jgi:tetratricopeptide (TPR) repeat protein